MQTMADAADAQGPSADDYRIVMGSSGAGHSIIEALHPADGLMLWYYETGEALDDFIAGDGMVFLSTSTAALAGAHDAAWVTALRASDGAVLWRRGPEHIRRQTRRLQRRAWLAIFLNTGELVSAWRMAALHRLAGYTRLSTDGDVVCACTASDTFVFGARDGRLRWTHIGYATVRAGRVYIKDNPRSLLALDARTGRQIWNYSNRYLMDFTVGDTHVFVRVSTGRGWKLQALRISDGVGERVLAQPGDMHDLVALADNGVAYLRRSNQLAAVRIDDGAELWRSGPLTGAPEDADSLAWRLAVATRDGFFYARYVFEHGLRSMIVCALDAGSGAKLWEWRGPQQPRAERRGLSMAPVLGNLIVGTWDGLYALAGGDGQPLWHIPAGFSPVGRAPMAVRVQPAAASE